MPHLLIAGATGSGKSVMVNALITSLLCEATPDDVRMILMDLKRVELAAYNGLPHLLVPVITEPERAKAALKWAVNEMEGRYRRFAGATARNIRGYNETRVDPEDRLPYIVIIIDELADLMMREGKNVEEPIVRLAQKARATGIHMVLATQRPSVNVVTGLIKANFPSRIAFAMASQIDSRTILDAPGAEDLIGRGDMLYQPSDMPRPMRLQGVFVSDPEIAPGHRALDGPDRGPALRPGDRRERRGGNGRGRRPRRRGRRSPFARCRRRDPGVRSRLRVAPPAAPQDRLRASRADHRPARGAGLHRRVRRLQRAPGAAPRGGRRRPASTRSTRKTSCRPMADPSTRASSSPLPSGSRPIASPARLTVATAESCTGGLVAHAITEVAGLVRLLPGWRRQLLRRRRSEPCSTSRRELIAAHGAVSAQVARAMADGRPARLGAGLAVAVTGIAGPDGGTDEKPVGLTYVGVADAERRRRPALPLDGRPGGQQARPARVAALELLLERARRGDARRRVDRRRARAALGSAADPAGRADPRDRRRPGPGLRRRRCSRTTPARSSAAATRAGRPRTARPLEAAGIALDWAHDPAHVAAAGRRPDRLAVTKALTAIEPDHPELAAARAAGIPLEAWQQVVADAAAGRTLVGVAGTHGKSTTVGLAGPRARRRPGADPSAFVGALLPPR